MPLPMAFRAKQISYTVGTADFELSRADARFQSFAAATNGASAAVLYSASFGALSAEREIGIGVFDGNDPGSLTRVEVLMNHLGTTAKVAFGAGAKDIQLLSLPGQRRQIDFSSNTTVARSGLGCIYNFTGSAAANLQLPAVSTPVPINTGIMVRNGGTAGAIVAILAGGSDNVGTSPSLALLPGEMVELWATSGGWLVSGLPALALIRSQVISGTPSVIDFALPVASASYEIDFARVNQSADGQMLMRVSSDGGSTFDAGGTDYGRFYDFFGDSGQNRDRGTGASIIVTDVGDSAGHACGDMRFYCGDGTRNFRLQRGHSVNANPDATLIQGGRFFGGRTATGAANAIRFLPSSGTFTAGRFSLYLLRS